MCANTSSSVIVHADKTVLKITGLSVRGLDTVQLENILRQKLQSMVRIIGVTGTSIDMDIYGMAPEEIYRDEAGLLQAVSLCDGILATEVAAIASAERIVELDWDSIPDVPPSACLRERILMMANQTAGGSDHE